MSRFYIKYIAASGDKVAFSKIEFDKGINIIHGPSNTGKSYVLGCINFMFGGANPFTKVSTGYDTISIRFENDEGEYVCAERTIIDGKSKERGNNTVKVTTSVQNINGGEYKISDKTYSDLLLKLIGVDSRHKIIAKQDGTQHDLTIRTIFHFLYLDEDHIFGKPTPFYSPTYNNVTACLSALLFLLDGKDYQEILPTLSAEERKKKGIQRAGVIQYLDNKIQELMKRRAEVVAAMAEMEDIDIEAAMDSVLGEIDSIDRQIVIASEESKGLAEQIYSATSRLEEVRFLQERYQALRSQYASDIRRLKFITDGERKMDRIPRLVVCPFCDQKMKDGSSEKSSYLNASDSEMERIKAQMQDLKDAQKDVDSEAASLEAKIASLQNKNEEITSVINEELRPRAAELKNTVTSYRRILLQRREIYALEMMASELNSDITYETPDEDESNVKFQPRKILVDSGHWRGINVSFETMVQECAYPGKPVARIDIDTCDPVVGGKLKSDEGKGYRAFLNTIMLFNLMRYMDAHGRYASHFLFLDSPILSLKEKKRDIAESEKITPEMRTSLFNYMISHCEGDQVIISENELPDGVDYSSAKLIEFTKDERKGIYGFLRTNPTR